MATLVILRHGESVANRDNVFTGWSDVPLTSKGREQARIAGQAIARTGLQFGALHTSMLQRAIVTANLVLEQIDQLYIPEYKSWRLNERHYGALRGHNKDQVRDQVGDRQVKIWRRSFDVVPPLLEQVDQDRRYDRFGPHIEPRGESLEMAYHRLMPYWVDQVAPRLLAGQNQLIVAHGSTLRALIKYLDRVPDADISQVEVANGEPIRYEFDDHLKILKKTLL
ncbi:2,3-bisphosphoglycerate-dependent phosphoglycerate mutase [Levilactobacillus namurensis]|uniref:2,3-bisphosphoglycerate-dependent phosphoglycerate mutase n=1 Tax=Levilactobacillus namurensis TaxID=380393 RepID=A0AAW8W8N3_9LACO|nr:2,3-diphosphoglycerate-dependent phosphoglycerate mutase [Levilactobacillus namurensis]PTM21560.1 phosphoglycerate mutase [Lactobacillus sp. PFC-70]MCW3779614.1 2,3-diphosphoglycerate-dependent phosphoglycerate mutase [Levilactobacillus namurensis]MDT7015113.1 2,3-diphosphoglycerate-dependent phosphoglycerate mutase [Levilactobacillus namurensis]MDT7017936.1 2,3-diphosphoglycerate-dependent phosphoglycerate mutase [Levilactobacillus namurensis]WNN65064.1 2,3-diphosphoglycerate-dependent pho